MSTGDLNLPIELLGHKGRIRAIWSRVALPLWQEADELLAYVEFDEPIDSTAGYPISVPVKDYSPEEFLRVVRENGEKELAAALQRWRQERAQRQAKETREEGLKKLAVSIAAKFKAG